MRFIRTTIAMIKATVENSQDSLKTTTKKKAVVNAIIIVKYRTAADF